MLTGQLAESLRLIYEYMKHVRGRLDLSIVWKGFSRMSSFNYINVDWSAGRVSSTHLRIHELVRSTLISAVGRKELSWMSLLTASTSIGQVVDPLQLMWYTCRFAEGVRKIRVAERTFLDVVVNCTSVDGLSE